MSYDPAREIKRKKAFIKESVLKCTIIMFAALLLAAEFYYRGDFNGIMDHISEDLSTPRPGALLPIPAMFSIFPIDKTTALKFCAAGLLIWFVWFVTDWIDYTQKKNMRPGEEHGSATFNLDYGKVEHDYIMSAKVLKDFGQKTVFEKILTEGGYKIGRHGKKKRTA